MQTDPAHDESHHAAPRVGQRQSVWTLWWRALRLRCPACGRARIFRGWFAMNETCSACGRRFARDAGYLLGSIYFNYGVTAALVVAVYFTMYTRNWLADHQRLLLLSLFAIAFPTWFFRYARAFWMAFDERWDPWPNEEEARSARSASKH